VCICMCVCVCVSCLLCTQRCCRGTLTVSHKATLQQISDSTATRTCAHIHLSLRVCGWCVCVCVCVCVAVCLHQTSPIFSLSHPPIYPHFLCVSVSLSPRVPAALEEGQMTPPVRHITAHHRGPGGHLETNTLCIPRHHQMTIK